MFVLFELVTIVLVTVYLGYLQSALDTTATTVTMAKNKLNDQKAK